MANSCYLPLFSFSLELFCVGEDRALPGNMFFLERQYADDILFALYLKIKIKKKELVKISSRIGRLNYLGNILLFFISSFQHKSNTRTLLLPVPLATKSVLWIEVNPCRGLSEFSSYGETVRNILHRMFPLVNVFLNPVDLGFLAVLLPQPLPGPGCAEHAFYMGTQIRCGMPFEWSYISSSKNAKHNRWF